MSTSALKLQRWLDLLAALLSRKAPATFTELAREIPGYDGALDAEPKDTSFQSAKRAFERDKDELRALGIPIVSHGTEGDESAAYQLRTKDFYLPYLALVSERGIEKPAKVDRYGYHSLETLAFEPDELEAIRDGVQRATQVGDAILADHARNALHKLAFDLPIGAIDGANGDATIVPPLARADSKLLATLGDALLKRKRVAFQYSKPGAAGIDERTVEPYGLFFLSGHWYLTARDEKREDLRNFRVSRMTHAKVSTARAATPDYEIPRDFNLREHSRSRLAWELGDGDGVEALVDFRGTTGAARAASALGRVAEGSPTLRTFDVRRVDSFARWLLSFGGDAVPVAPAALVDEYTSLRERTRSLYAVNDVAQSEGKDSVVAQREAKGSSVVAQSEAKGLLFRSNDVAQSEAKGLLLPENGAGQ